MRWRASIPDTAAIVISAQSGADANSLLPTTPLAIVTASTSTAASTADVAYIDTGTEGGAFNKTSPTVLSDIVLRLTITLKPTADQLSAPTLLDWSVAYDCIPSL